MSVTVQQVPEEIRTLVNFLRQKLVQHGFAFGAVYCVKRGEGDVLMVDERMPHDKLVFMLRDLISAAELAAQRFEQ
jgi:hypothetical protein